KRIGADALNDGSGESQVGGTAQADPLRVSRDAGARQRVFVTGTTQVNARRRAGARQKRDATAAQSQQVIGDDEAGAAIINADQVVMAAAREAVDVAVEQNDRNACAVKGITDATVDRVTVG